MATALSDSAGNTQAMPPPVRYPLGSPRAMRRLAMLAWGLVVVVDGYWLAVAPQGDWRPWAGVLVAVGAGGWAWWRAGPLVQSGGLAWDGAMWWWEQASGSVAGRIEVRLDVQSGLLLRFVADTGSAAWFWLERTSSPVHWLAMRRAACAASGQPAVSMPVAGNRAASP